MLTFKQCIHLFFVFLSLISVAGSVTSSAEALNKEPRGKSAIPADTLIYHIPTVTESFDPARSHDIETSNVMANIYEGLMSVDPVTRQLVPNLAESVHTSEDLKTYTFKLRESIYFHDDTPFTSEAVRATFERQMGSRRTSDMILATEAAAQIKSIETPDEHTVILKLNRPNPAFLHALAQVHSASIVSPAALKKYDNDLSEHPVGTGPYKLVSRNAAGDVRLKLFDRHPDANNISVRNVLIRTVKNDYARLKSVMEGRADLTCGLSYGTLSDLANDDFRVFDSRNALLGVLVFNSNSHRITTEDDVRFAVAEAVNVKKFVRELFDGHAEAAYTIQSPDFIGYAPPAHPLEYAPLHASKIFKKHDARELTLLLKESDRGLMRQDVFLAGELLSDMLEKAGVRLKIMMCSDAAYHARINEGAWDLSLRYVDTTRLTGVQLFASLSELYNTFKLDHAPCEVFSNLMLQALTCTDITKRVQFLREIELHIEESLPVMPVVYTKTVVAGSPSLTGVFIHPLGYIMFDRINKL